MAHSFRRALNRFEAAVRNHEMIGAHHPAARAEIEREYEKSKHLLIYKWKAMVRAQQPVIVPQPDYQMSAEEEAALRKNGTIV